MAISSSILPIDPNQLNSTGFELADQTIIPSQDITSTFDPNTDTIEFYIYDGNNNLINSNYNFRNYRIIKNSTGEASTDEIELFPAQDIQDAGFENGTLFGLYNFINLELNSSNDVPYFISEISSDRTEIRLKSNVIDNQSIETSFNILKQKLDSADFFDEFYISFKDNEYYIAVNTLLQTEEEQFSVLIKLYQPLPPEYQLKDELYVVTKPAESQAFQVDFIDDFILQDDIQFLKGPNINIDLKKRISNSSDLKNKSELLNTSNSSSLFTLENLLDRKGVNLTPNFSFDTFNEFVHFSTAKSRINNFVYKVGQIQGFESNLDTLNSITGSTTSSLAYTENVASLNTKISNIIKNFDEYEYFLYYQSSSFTYPKSNDSYPYTLYPTSSTEVKTWLGSDVESDPFYGGALLSASLYDQSNQNNLYYTIPEFIRDNTDNNQYLKFVELAGQHFDQLWLYTSYLTEKLNSTNQLDKGVPLEIAGEVIRSLGYQTFGNNFDNQDLYFGLVGAASSSLLPPTGSELINNYVAVNAQNVIESTGFPYAIDDVNRELYKRLFHNMVYLAKKKGTISGLRQLLNIWGVPNTVLRISEFGGKDKINTNDWDYWYKRFNFELNTVTNNEAVQTDFRINPKWNAPDNRPGTVEFRFKTPIPNANTPQSQSLWSLDATGKSRVVLEYEADFTSGSYSGSIINPEYQYANLKLFPNFFGESNLSASIRLPFFNNDFWNVVVTRDGEDFQLFSGNKIYNGSDGTKLGFFASSSISASSSGWTTSTISNFPDDSGDGLTNYSPFTGSYQEIRYYTEPISESVIRDHIMNPQSIEGNGINGSYNTLAFRGSIGGELYTGSISVHPKVSGSFITQSFYNGAISSSAFTINGTFSGSREFVFFDSPAAGIRTRVADKVRVPNVKIEGNVLSSNTSIQQNLLISQSYTENINNLEVAFSPQNEINDDIIQSIGFGDVQRILADPRNISSSLNFYPGLKNVAEDYFRKYFKANQKDYLRLIRFIDNSLFKATENYVPARTGISTGIVIKQHILERNRVRPPQPSLNTTLSPGFIFQNIQVSASIDTAFFSGSTGGSLNKYNFTGSGEFGQITLDQSYSRTVQTKSGSVVIVEDKQREFYDGEFSGSELVATTQSLFHNPYKQFFDLKEHNFDIHYTEVGTGWLNPSQVIEDTQNGINSFSNISPGLMRLYYLDPFVGPGPISITGLSISIKDKDGNSLFNSLKNPPEEIIIRDSNNPLSSGPLTLDFTNLVKINNSASAQFDYILQPDPSRTGPDDLGLTISSSNQLININPILPENIGLFENTDFFATPNNINDNRTSKFHADVDYSTDSVVPINRQNIIEYFDGSSDLITLTQVPESNYTSKTFTTLRYDGSKNSADDYNITSSKGDLPPIQKNPIAFARFDSSFENRSVFGTRNYIIDSIIESPFESIVGTDVIPKVKRVSSNVNSNVLLPDSTLGVGVDPIEMAGFFEKNRDAIVVFDDLQVGELGQSELKNIRAKIFRGGYELGAIITNQNSVNSLQNFTFSTASWVGSTFSPNSDNTTVDRQTGFDLGVGFSYFLETGSTNYTANTSSLVLRGGGFAISQSLNFIGDTPGPVSSRVSETNGIFEGPGLGLIHSHNYAVKNNETIGGNETRILNSVATSSLGIVTASIGLPALDVTGISAASPPDFILGTSTVDPEVITNYFRFNFNASDIETYKNLGYPFLIEPDDEIRVTVDLNYGSITTDTPNFQTFNFTVTKITNSIHTINPHYSGSYNDPQLGGLVIDGGFRNSTIFDVIEVTPDPSTLNIPNGVIDRFTITRNKNKADNVILFQTPFPGDEGALNPSTGGFLIPNDFTKIQKENAITLINQIREKNGFV